MTRSPIREGFCERQHFADAVASLWIDGELVQLEDLVLHDAHMDIRTPTHELIRAHDVFRARRQIFSHPPGWALSPQGIVRLRGRGADDQVAAGVDGLLDPPDAANAIDEDSDQADEFRTELAAIDAVLAKSQAVLDGVVSADSRRRADERDPLVYDADWNEDERLGEWRTVFGATEGLPPVLRAALLLDAWNQLQVLQHAPWLGRLLVASLLRQESITTAHLLALNLGLRAIPRERRYARDLPTRLLAFLEAVAQGADIGQKEHDRLLLAKTQMERRLVDRQANSKLPRLIELVVARPMVSSGMIARELDITPQGAVNLARQLSLREITGRKRYRAWGLV